MTAAVISPPSSGGDPRRVTENVHDAAERLAEVHEALGPEATVLAAALTLLSSPTTVAVLRRAAVGVVAKALTIGDTVLKRRPTVQPPPDPRRLLA